MSNPSALSMLSVVNESRERAMAQREAATEHLAALALSAITQGEDVREVAKLCGFDLDAPAEPEPEPDVTTITGMLALHARGRQPTQAQRFAHWLGEAAQRIVLEQLGEGSE